MRLCIICVSVAVAVNVATNVVHGQPCNPSSWPTQLFVNETAVNGTEIFRLSQEDDVSLDRSLTPKPPRFIGITNGSLHFSDTFDLDRDQDLCSYIENNGYWRIFVKCNTEPVKTINIQVTPEDNFPPEFIQNFTKQVPELSALGTTVLTVDNTDITDRDCQSNTQVGSTTRFGIEGGNTRDAFVSNLLTGAVTVNRQLDYENGDKQFLLNMSVSDRSSPDRKSYATLTVNVIDIDDNDPAFNHSSYLLHVKEEDTSSVNVWLQTEPPVSVYDPDIDAMPKDPLIISLYDPNDSGNVTVDNTTGEIQLHRTFDREQEPYFTAVLKVRQTEASWRSSTVTMTVVVDDINDNRPLFEPALYNVTVAEHSMPGTSVLVLSATDTDIGDNAVFNYTLQSQLHIFSISTELYGDQRLGVLYVLNSTALDRELTPQLLVQVGTQELEPEEGESCSERRCNATVTITLLDVNDNSPLFNVTRYDVTLHDASPHDVIVTVHATDADAGENARVTYSLKAYDGFEGCAGVVLDPVSGEVRLNQSVMLSQRCYYLVMACDNPSQLSERRCTSVPLQLYFQVQASNYTVLLEAPVAPGVLNPEKTSLQRELSAILQVTVTVGSIVPRSAGQGSTVYISATDSTTPVPAEQLQQLVDKKADEIRAMFNRYVETSDGEESDDFPPHVIALMVVAIVLLLALIVAVIFISRGHRSQKRQRRLIRQLSTSNDIYDNADLSKAKTGTDTSSIHIADDQTTGDLGVVNPVYQNDDSHGSLSQNSPDNDVSLDSRGRETQLTMSDRLPDADSGVPSDRDVGMEESGSDSSKQTSPALARREESNEGTGGSLYLNAVLASAAGDFILATDASDMIDVTSLPPLYNGEITHFNRYDDIDPELRKPNCELHPVGVQEADVGAESYPHDHVSAVGDQDCPETEKEHMKTMALAADTEGRPSNDLPSPDPVLVSADSLQGPGTENWEQEDHHTSGEEQRPLTSEDTGDEEDEEVGVGVGSRLSLLVAPSTPPMKRSSNKGAEPNELEETLPEEPEPDYAKKVRFSVQVTEHVHSTDDKSDMAEERTEDTTSGGTDVDENGVSSDEPKEKIESGSCFNVEEELTAF